MRFARTIFASHLPIVSAVGHEIDTTIADYVADLRAATPSQAAEIVSPDNSHLKEYIQTLYTRLANAVQYNLQRSTQQHQLLQQKGRQNIGELESSTAP